MMDNLNLYLILQVAMVIFLSSAALLSSMPKKLKLHYFLLVFTTVEWFFLDSILSVTPAQNIQFLSNLLFVFVAFIPAAALSLIYRLYYMKRNYYYFIIYLIPLFFSAILLMTPLILESSIPAGYHISYIHGPIWPIFRFWIYGGLLALIPFFRLNLNNRLVVTRTHSKTLYYSVFIFLIFHFVGYVLIPMLIGSFVSQPLTIIADIIFLIFIYYVLSQKHPADPKVLLKKFIVHTLVFSLIFTVISISIFVLREWLQQSFDQADMAIFWVNSALIIIGYIPLRNKLVSLIDRMFDFKGYDYYRALKVISERIREYNDLVELGNYIVVVLRDTMKLERVSLYLYDEEREEYICRYFTGRPKHDFGQVGVRGFVDKLALSRGVVVRREGAEDRDEYSDYLSIVRGEAVVAIGRNRELEGYLVLGKKLSGEPYTLEDESILGTMANHLCTAIENTRLFTDIKSKAEKLYKLNELQKQIVYGQGKRRVYETVLQDVMESMEASRGYLYCWDVVNKELVCEVTLGTGEITFGDRERLDAQTLDRLESGEELTGFGVIRNEDADAGESILLSLMDHQEFMGALLLVNDSRRGYVKNIDLQMLRVYANYMGNLIKNFSLYNEAVIARDYSEGILRAINNVVMTLDRSGRIVSLNESGRRELGVEIGDSLNQIRGDEELVEMIERGMAFGEELTNREISRCGGKKDYTVTLKLIKGEAEGKENLLVLLTDVTEVKALKQELLQKERLVTIANMASVIVHEIRNPLTSVSTLTRLMPMQHNDKEYVELFNSVVPRELERVNLLMEDLLELSRTRKLEKRPLDIQTLLAERVKVLRELAKAAGVELELIGEPQRIEGDERKLTQVFQNIMQNGIQAMDEGGGRLSIELSGRVVEREGREAEMCVVGIRDNGRGMDEETREQIFKPFYTTRATGTGLGLAITQKIVEDHGGFMQVESRLGTGTLFLIFLPKK